MFRRPPRLTYWELRRQVHHLPPPRTPADYWQQEVYGFGSRLFRNNCDDASLLLE